MSLISLQDAAARAGVHPRTIRRRIADGTIEGFKVGRLVRVRAEDVDKLAQPIPVGVAR